MPDKIYGLMKLFMVQSLQLFPHIFVTLKINNKTEHFSLEYHYFFSHGHIGGLLNVSCFIRIKKHTFTITQFSRARIVLIGCPYLNLKDESTDDFA